jgi:glycosyltransferase involved in cell wall biosynthesis|tara:strand:+ start:741 stop:2021 length:1281 start_codon:yes stop_codon:yes gene_type:complete
MKKVCVISCPIATRSGYGARSRDFVKSLIDLKGQEWDIKILAQRWGTTPQNALTPEDDTFTSRLIPQLESKPDIWIQITIPSEFQPVGNFNIGVSAVIETSDASSEFIEGCNRMDLNIVSSRHSAATLTAVYDKLNDQTQQKIGELKIEKPVEVLFEGYDTNVFDNKKPIESTVKKVFQDIPEQFCFLFVGHLLNGAQGHDRKNVYSLIKVFLNTFKGQSFRNKAKPALILKTNTHQPSISSVHKIKTMIRKCKERIGGSKFPNIYILDGDLTNDEINSVYNHPQVKAHVSFTHGEGFGRPLLEACVSGKPIIASAWSGHLDFLHKEYNFLVGGGLEEVHPSVVNKWIMKGTRWFKIDHGQASGVLKSVYNHYKRALEMSRKNRHFVKTNFTQEKMTEKLGELLTQYKVGEGPTQVGLKLPKLKKK